MTELLLEGGARERGEQHGETLRETIHEAVARWSELVEARGQDPRKRTASLVGRSPYLTTLQQRCPDLLEEVRGIADGAAVPFAEVLVLNLMDEEWWFREGEESGCSLAAGRLASEPGGRTEHPGGMPILAQNMDLPEWMDGLQTVLRIRGDGEETALLSAAGMIGLTGMRFGGVAVGVNTLLQLPRDVRGVPVAFAIRSALRRPNAETAAGFLAALPHASGQHYAVADADHVFGLECSARGTAVRRFDGDEWLLHTNHPLWTEVAAVASPETVGIHGIRLHSSHRRLDALRDFSEGSRTARRVRETLADTSTGVCMVASNEYPTSTFGSVEFSPAEGIAGICAGSPAEAGWSRITANR